MQTRHRLTLRWEWNQQLSGSNYWATSLFPNFSQFPHICKWSILLGAEMDFESWERSCWRCGSRCLSLAASVSHSFLRCFRGRVRGNYSPHFYAVMETRVSRFCFHSSTCSGTSGWLLAPFDPLTDSAAEIESQTSSERRLKGDVTSSGYEFNPYRRGRRWSSGPQGKLPEHMAIDRKLFGSFASSHLSSALSVTVN